MWAYALLTFAKFEMDEQKVRIRKMRVKRILCGLFVASIIVTLFAASALATEPSGDWTVDWETSYMNLKNEDHHANFTPVQVYYNYGSWFHDAWVSTEVSVPANGDGYAFAEIKDTNGVVRAGDISSDNKHAKFEDGWMKLDAVYGTVNGAQQVRFAGKQIVVSYRFEKLLKWINNA